jgi:GDP-D-mannose 3', 5'-epimerase
VRSRNFSNGRIVSLGWRAHWPLRRGIEATYPWIAAQVGRHEFAVAGAS